MKPNEPGIAQMIRAPFLSSILSPILSGTLLAVVLSGEFNPIGFLLVFIMGIGLHAATNVYNDIYDTLQGTDKVNIHRNEFSGGSGILINFPHLESKMFSIAHWSLILALFATAALMAVVNENLWPTLWGLYLLSAFFSKYYTAAPFKLASRGFGEISVWFAFGPMALLVATVSQNVGYEPAVIVAMPITGLSTSSILLIGQLIDRPADEETGKHGVAIRAGTRLTALFYALVQLALVSNVIVLAFQSIENWWPILLSLAPYALLLPKCASIVLKHHAAPDELKPAAGINVQLHLGFSVLFFVGWGIILFS